MAVNYYWWKRKPRHIVQCIWEETTDLPQVNWQTFSLSHIGQDSNRRGLEVRGLVEWDRSHLVTSGKIRTDAGWRWEVSWNETDVLTIRPRGLKKGGIFIVPRDLGFFGFIQRPVPFSCLLRRTRGCWGPILCGIRFIGVVYRRPTTY
jgi:hypothetical protein